MLRTRAIQALAILGLLTAEARANVPSFEVWGSSEFQLTISPETDPDLAWHDIIPDRLRVYTEIQYAHDIGLQQSQLRVGPIWNLLPWFSYSMHAVSVALPTSSGRFNQEVRLEAEPSFKDQILPELRWNNRHRLEYRIRPDKQFWRYRTRLGLSYHIPDSPWTPFVSNEFHFVSGDAVNPAPLAFAQNRALLGISHQLDPSTQISLSYLFRMVLGDGIWVPENGLFFSLLYSSREDGFFQSGAD